MASRPEYLNCFIRRSKKLYDPHKFAEKLQFSIARSTWKHSIDVCSNEGKKWYIEQYGRHTFEGFCQIIRSMKSHLQWTALFFSKQTLMRATSLHWLLTVSYSDSSISIWNVVFFKELMHRLWTTVHHPFEPISGKHIDLMWWPNMEQLDSPYFLRRLVINVLC